MNHKELKKSDIKKIDRLIELTYLSEFLKDKLPISLMLISPPEQSKTFFILSKKTDRSEVITDLSWKGVINLLKDDKNKDNLKHLIIPDLLKLTRKKKSTTDNLLSLLNGYLEEGIFKINVGNDRKIDFKGKSGGMITATTKKSFERNRKNWEHMGLSSRFLKVSYKLSTKTIKNIMRKIAKKNNNIRDVKKIETEDKSIELKKEHIEKIVDLSNNSIRKFRNLTTLLESIALSYNREKTIDKDFNELKSLMKFINLDFNLINE